jgi:hypothetical protein
MIEWLKPQVVLWSLQFLVALDLEAQLEQFLLLL